MCKADERQAEVGLSDVGSLAQTWSYVCTDAGAGGYEAFPDVCRMADGRLMAVFYAGYGHISLPNVQLPLGGRICFSTSADEGQTWAAAQTLFDGPDDDRDPSIVQLKDGRLACSFFTLKANPDALRGFDGMGSFLVTSADGGATWATEPQQISTNYYCSSPVRELMDGRLALGLYAETAEGATGAVTFSEDGGATWGQPVDIPTGGLRYDAETDVIERSDGSLFAALRGQDYSGWSVSTDGGTTWSVAELFGFPMHCPYLHRTPDDIILMAHRLPYTSLHYSLDECKTWSTNVVVDTFGGAYPSMVTLNDGSILFVYYEEGAGSNIRAKRFRATRSGIEWLTVSISAWAGYFATPVHGWQYVYDARFDGRPDQDGWLNDQYQFATPENDPYSAVRVDPFTGEKTLYATSGLSGVPIYFSGAGIPLQSTASNEVITVDVRFRAGDAAQPDSTRQFQLATLFRNRFDGLAGRQYGCIAVSKEGLQYTDAVYSYQTIGLALGTNWHTGRMVFDFPAKSYHMYLDDSTGKLFTATMCVDGTASNNRLYVGDGSGNHAGQMNISYLRYSTNLVASGGATTNLVVTHIDGNTTPTSQAQGWAEVGSGGSVAGGTEGSIPYWGITAAGLRYYAKNVGVSELYHHAGWTATAKMRVLSNSPKSISSSAVFHVLDGVDYFGFNFYTNEVDYVNASAGSTTLADLDTVSRFHIYQICFTPFTDSGLGSVEFFVDGVLVGTKTRTDTFNYAIAQTSGGRIQFGAGASAGASETRWASVTFEVGRNIYVPPTPSGTVLQLSQRDDHRAWE